MSTRALSLIFSILVIGTVLSCEPDRSDAAIPTAVFTDLVLNLSLPEYNDLNSKGFKYISGGVRGMIIVKLADTYKVYERNCSYQPNEACATVEMHSSNLYMVDPCCGSMFNRTDGSVQGGSAWRPLLIYTSYLNGATLTITDEPANY